VLKRKNKRALSALAEAFGIQTAYRDALGKRRQASTEAVFATLRALGAPLASIDEAADALRMTEHRRWADVLSPVTVVWQGRAASVVLRLPGDASSMGATLSLENGETQTLLFEPAAGKGIEAHEESGRKAVRFRLPALPAGYHRLTLDLPNSPSSLVICAPYKAFPVDYERLWGVFLPVYALRSERGFGAGDLTDLSELIQWVGSLGGSAVASLPLLASFLKKPFEPSPYAPVSRLFWNEFYLDLTKPDEYERCVEAREYLGSREVMADATRLRSLPLVDYRAEMAIKRKVLELLASAFFTDSNNGQRREQYADFVKRNPEVERYARFQSVVERQGTPWPAWTDEALKHDHLEEVDFDHAAYHYHLYAQWMAEEQMGEAARRARANGLGLYLDLPLGVHYDGYDVWSRKHLFALGHAAGAPPDPLFTKGQNWGFPPFIPAALRNDGYEYVIQFIRNHLRFAGVLRIDHVMQLHRLFWIPHGMGAGEGLYVHYPAEEMYAILSLESHRYRAWIVGENLGTVPSYVNQALEAHNIQRMYVVQYEVQPDEAAPLRPVPRDVVASLNTHDMPPFASFWNEADIEDRIDLGILAENDAAPERATRARMRNGLQGLAGKQDVEQTGAAGALRGVLRELAAGEARMVLVNLEDLWLEEKPQNTPGTVDERPNWRRRARYDLNALKALPEVEGVLQEIDAIRKGNKEGS
jgi:4-alpha-glucanotransferase